MEKAARLLRSLSAEALSYGPIPQHVAFIMDGNRRYAEQNRKRNIEGHVDGYQSLIRALEWSLELGIRCVSVYAFSVDNFRRRPDEVDALMDLATEKLRLMVAEEEVLRRHGVQVRVVGDLSIIPRHVRLAAEEVMRRTSNHDQAVLNICFSYTSSRELQQAMEEVAQTMARTHRPGGEKSCEPSARTCGHNSGRCTSANIIDVLDDHMYTAGCPPVDLMIRTSGESRLSDFLMFQSRHAILHFSHVLWPNFSFMDLVKAILSYQSQSCALQRSLRRYDSKHPTLPQRGSALRLPSESVSGPLWFHLGSTRSRASDEDVKNKNCVDEEVDPRRRRLYSDAEPKIVMEEQAHSKASDSPTGVTTPESPSCLSSSSESRGIDLLQIHGVIDLSDDYSCLCIRD